METLRTKWGFSGLLIPAEQDKYDNAITAGYSLSNLMINVGGVAVANRLSTISHYGDAYAYYVGEPADEGTPIQEVRESLNTLGFSSLFVIDGYKRTYELDVDVSISDVVMFSSYMHWYEIGPRIWVSWPEDDDQRPDWTDMQDRYYGAFSMSWISTKEVAEYNDLFGHAQNLGLTGVWIYGYKEHDLPVAHYNDEFPNICAAAYSHGYLRQFIRLFYMKYQCVNPSGTSTPPPGEDWLFIGTESTNTVIED